MKLKTALLTSISCWLLVFSPTTRADEYITVNGLPCGTLCRTWMGIKLPAGEPKTPATAKVRQQSEDDAAPPRKTKQPKPHKKQVASHKAAKPEAVETPIATTSPKADPAPPAAADVASAPKTPEKSQEPKPAVPPDAAATPESKPSDSVGAATPPSPEPSADAKEQVVKRQEQPATPPTPESSPQPVAVETPAAQPTPLATATGDSAPAPVAEPQSIAVAPKEPPAPQPAPPPAAEPTTMALAPKETPSPQPTPSAVVETQTAAVSASPTPEATAGAEAKSIMIVLVTPKVKTLSDLADKAILVAGLSQMSKDALAASFEAGGASKVEFKPGEPHDLGPLERGEVSAAVVATVPEAAAEAFSEVNGFRVLRVPVLSR